MGIRDRDYMKGPSGGDDDRSNSSPSTDAEEKLGGVIGRNIKLLTYAGIALALLVVIAVVVTIVST
jgi:hypothetical protein